jgi:hypothetical protein
MAADFTAMSINAMPMATRWRTNLTPNSGRKLQTKKNRFGNNFADITDCKGGGKKKKHNPRLGESTESDYPQILNIQELSFLAKKEQSICVNIVEENNVIVKVYQPVIAAPSPNPGRNTSSNVYAKKISYQNNKKRVPSRNSKKICIEDLDEDEILWQDWVWKQSKYVKKWRKRWAV